MIDELRSLLEQGNYSGFRAACVDSKYNHIADEQQMVIATYKCATFDQFKELVTDWQSGKNHADQLRYCLNISVLTDKTEHLQFFINIDDFDFNALYENDSMLDVAVCLSCCQTVLALLNYGFGTAKVNRLDSPLAFSNYLEMLNIEETRKLALLLTTYSFFDRMQIKAKVKESPKVKCH